MMMGLYRSNGKFILTDTGIFELGITASGAGYEEISKLQTFEAIGGKDEQKQSSEKEED